MRQTQRRCTFCNTEQLCCYSMNATYKTWDGSFESYRYWSCRDNVIHTLYFQQSHLLIKYFFTILLCHDVYRVIFDLTILLTNKALAPCYQKKLDYININTNNKTINQLKTIAQERGIACPKRAKKAVYQNLIKRDIDAARLRWQY